MPTQTLEGFAMTNSRKRLGPTEALGVVDHFDVTSKCVAGALDLAFDRKLQTHTFAEEE
jgi:hypothetical protein